MKKAIFLMCILSLGTMFISCGDDELTSDNVHAIEIYLTDDPIDAEEVNIEILSVILVGEDVTHEIELNTISGIYNLLDFQGDIDTLIASGNFDLDKIKEIRLILGTNNTIKIDGEEYPLKIPSGADSGLKIKVDEELIGKSLVSLLIDFDACKSVKEMHGEYKLSPVIHYKGDRNKKDLDLDEVLELDSCFMIEFPVSVKNADGTVSMVGTAEELAALIEAEAITGIVYPFNVIDEEGKSHKINNAKQAEKLVDECEGEDDHGGGKDYDFSDVVDSILVCFEIQYPLSVVLEDGTMAEVVDDQALVALEGGESFVFPFYMVAMDGDVKKVNNSNQLLGLLRNCADEDDDDDDENDFHEMLDSLKSCFEIQYPLYVVLDDGTTVEIFDIHEIKDLQHVADLVFPFFVIAMDGEVISIDDMDGLREKSKKCRHEDDDDDDDHGGMYDDFEDVLDDLLDCFEIVFPMVVIDSDSMELTVDSLEQLIEEIKKGNVISFASDITVIDAEGNTIVIDSFDALAGVLGSCMKDDHHNEIFDKLKDCIEFEFPLTIEKNGEKIEVQNMEELIALFESGEECKFVYPFKVKNNKGMMHKSKKINNGNQLRKLLEDCD